jgi:Icc-related predicted phosphoesterase
MRIVFISDTHSLHGSMRYDVVKFLDSNQTNILVHSGDCTNIGKENEVIEFVQWFQNLKGFDTKIFIAGNHDFAFEQKPVWLFHYINSENLSQSDCVYLEDDEFVIEDPEFSRPIKFYGSPWQPEFFDWAFNLKRGGDELLEKWNKIPDDTDVLITHGPPFGYLDITPQNSRVGCELLEFRVKQFNPLFHAFGHIHHSYGIIERDGTFFVNGSICDERYRPKNKPIAVDLREVNGKMVVEYVDL